MKNLWKTCHNPLNDYHTYIYLDTIKFSVELNYVLFIFNTFTIFLLF